MLKLKYKLKLSNCSINSQRARAKENMSVDESLSSTSMQVDAVDMASGNATFDKIIEDSAIVGSNDWSVQKIEKLCMVKHPDGRRKHLDDALHKNWVQVGEKLGSTKGDIATFQRDIYLDKTDERQVIGKIFANWVGDQGSRAKLNILVAALEDSRCQSVADAIRKSYEEKQNPLR